MKTKQYALFLGLTAALLIAISIIVFQKKENQFLRANMPYLLPKEKISYFNLVGVDNECVDLKSLDGKPSLIYVFKTPCSACNENVLFWKKIADVLKDEANVFGVVLSGYGEMVDFAEEARLNFKLYYPVEPKKFKQSLKLKLNIAQTIVYNDGAVLLVKLGSLDGDEYTKILRHLKEILRNKRL